jgi:DNA-binding NtrC family response regulator
MSSSEKNRTVLVIEDDEMQIVALRTTLALEGYTVYTTADGPQGITIFSSKRPDLVLLDIGLPSMSGIAVLEEIRRIDPAARIIVITGYASVESAVQAIQSGAVDFLQKPYEVEVLLRKISTALSSPHTS